MIVVDTGAGLIAALRGASSGDVIALAPGAYSPSISGLSLNGVTITSADFSRPAVITALNVTGTSGLTFSDLEFRADAAAGDNAFRVSSSQNMTFQRLNVHGSMDGDPQNDVAAFLLRSSSNITVKDSEFQQLSRAVSHLSLDGFTLSGNFFHDLRSDGVLGGGSSRVNIQGNRFTNFFPVKGDHPDAIQFWTSNTTQNAVDIRIADNVVTRGSGAAMQGVFMGDEAANVFYERVTVENNLISGGMYHGINIASAFGVTIRGNVVQGYDDMKSWIRIDDVDGATITDNRANTITITATDKNVVLAGNTLLPQANDRGNWAFFSWSARQDMPQAARIEPVATSDPDLVFAGSGPDRILGGAGADTLIDVAGVNYLRGEDGDDIIRGGFDFDDINGNTGNDSLFGGAGNDWVVGGRDSDSLSGEAGDDLVYGNLGSDTLLGGDGADTLRGGQGDDMVQGGAGSDFVAGDLGADTLSGGRGADVFYSFAGTGVDVIADFNVSDGDRIRLAPGSTWTVEQIGFDVVINIGGGGQVVLSQVSLSALPAGWIFT